MSEPKRKISRLEQAWRRREIDAYKDVSPESMKSEIHEIIRLASRANFYAGWCAALACLFHEWDGNGFSMINTFRDIVDETKREAEKHDQSIRDWKK